CARIPRAGPTSSPRASRRAWLRINAAPTIRAAPGKSHSRATTPSVARGVFLVSLNHGLAQRFTDEVDRNYPAGDRPARDSRHLLHHRLETFYRPPSPSANRAQVRSKPDTPSPRPISGGKPW